MHCLGGRGGEGVKGPERQAPRQAVTKDESERGSSLVVARGEIVKAKQGDSVARERAREYERRRRTSQIKRMEEVEKKKRRKKNGDTAGREAARLARQVQRARARGCEFP